MVDTAHGHSSRVLQAVNRIKRLSYAVQVIAGNIATTMSSVDKFGNQTIFTLGEQSTAAADIYPVISGDGRYVAFTSAATKAWAAFRVSTRASMTASYPDRSQLCVNW